MRPIVHILLHIFVPALLARQYRKNDWLRIWGVWLLTWIVDLDHLLAVPIYDPNRCSIGFHPLHSSYAMSLYVLLVVPKKTRLVGLGLVLHMLLDAGDCLWMHV